MNNLVKICGLQEIDHVKSAENSDYIGFVIGSPLSRRNIGSNLFNKLSNIYPEKSVAVTVNDNLTFLKKVRKDGECVIQLHGNSRKHITNINGRKAIAVTIGELKEKKYKKYYKNLEYMVVDSSNNQYGGTGKIWNWEKLPSLDIPILIAGGLSINNVDDALYETGAQGVDISSGVEIDGKKSIELVRQTIMKVKSHGK